MELKPITRYSDPAYPTRQAVDAQPELLRRLPRRWQRNAAIVGTMASVLGLGLAGHLSAQAANVPLMLGEMIGPEPPKPRYILNEEEAAAIITQELKKVGLAPIAETFQLNELPVLVKPATDIETAKTVAISLKVDQYDEKKQIGVEYVTVADVASLEKQFPEVKAVTQSATAMTASALQQAIDTTVPKATHLKTFPAIPSDTKENAQATLRTQVREFLQYLKGEGVI